QEEKWAAARTGYAEALKKEEKQFSPKGRRLIQRLIACSQRLGEWDEARVDLDNYAWNERRAIHAGEFEANYGQETERKERVREATERLEYRRQLVCELGDWLKQNPQHATPKRKEDAARALIWADFPLARHLLSDDSYEREIGTRVLESRYWRE